MRNFNGWGGISKLSGKRRRPFWARLTVGWEVNEETGKVKQVYKTLGYYATRKEAMLALAAYHQNPIDLTKRDIIFEEVWDIWSPKHFENFPSSERGLIAAYNKCESIKKMPMKDIRRVHLQKVLDGMSGMSESSQTKVKTIFKFTFKYCLENDILTKDYSQFVQLSDVKKTNSSKKFFTKEEINRIFDNLDFTVNFALGVKKYVELNLMDSVLILLYTGIRIGELLEQRIEDVDLENRIIRVRGTKTENADRLVPIHKDLVPIIENRMTGEFLIDDPRGKPLSYTDYKRKFFNSFKEKIGVNHTPHALRHTFISLMDSCGVSAGSVVLKRIVGHSNADVSEHYTHKQTNDLVEAIDKLKVR